MAHCPLCKQLGQIGEDQGTYIQISTDDFDKIQDYTLQLQTALNTAVAEAGCLDCIALTTCLIRA